MENTTTTTAQQDPVAFLTEELAAQGHATPEAWKLHLDERANDVTIPMEERLFFINRSLRLYMGEQTGRNHMQARMLLADGLSFEDWRAIIIKGVVPWLLDKLPVTKRQLEQAAAAVSSHREVEVTSNTDATVEAVEAKE